MNEGSVYVWKPIQPAVGLQRISDKYIQREKGQDVNPCLYSLLFSLISSLIKKKKKRTYWLHRELVSYICSYIEIEVTGQLPGETKPILHIKIFSKDITQI